MRRVYEHAGGLIYDDQMTVLKYNVERNILRPHRGFARPVEVDLDKVTAPYTESDIFMTAIYFALFVPHDLAKVHPAKPGEMIKEKILEPRPRSPIGNSNFYVFRHRNDSIAATDWSAGILACMSVASTRRSFGDFDVYAAEKRGVAGRMPALQSQADPVE